MYDRKYARYKQSIKEYFSYFNLYMFKLSYEYMVSTYLIILV